MLKTPLVVVELESGQEGVTPPPQSVLLEVARTCLLRVLSVSEAVPRLETILMGTPSEEVGFLSAVSHKDDEATRLIEGALSAVTANAIGPVIYARIYAPLARLLDEELERNLMVSPAPTLAEATRLLQGLRDDADHVCALRKRVLLNMVALDCVAINERLSSRIEALRDAVLQRYIDASRKHNRRFVNTWKIFQVFEVFDFFPGFATNLMRCQTVLQFSPKTRQD
jgi:hypothetical protein